MTINTVAPDAQLSKLYNDLFELSEKAGELEGILGSYDEKDFSSVEAFYSSDLYSKNTLRTSFSFSNRCRDIDTFFKKMLDLCVTYTHTQWKDKFSNTATKSVDEILRLFASHDKFFAKYEKLAIAVDNFIPKDDVNNIIEYVILEKQLRPTASYRENWALKQEVFHRVAQKNTKGVINIDTPTQQPTYQTKVRTIEKRTIEEPVIIAPIVVAPIAVKPPAITVYLKQEYQGELYVRGTGPGMNWENKGIKLTPIGDGKYTLDLPSQYDAFVCKILLNNNQWSDGENYQVAANGTLEATPEFKG